MAVLVLMLAVVMVKVEIAVLGRRRGACGGAFHLRAAPRPCRPIRVRLAAAL